MKKGIIVLLIAVLVAGFAFAGKITGSAGLQFNVDLQNKQWGFKNANDWNYTFTFTYDTTSVKVAGETDAYAELEIKGTATAAIAGKQAATATLVGTDPASGAGTVTNKVSVTLSKANIVFVLGEKKLVFGLLNAGAAADYVKTYYKVGSATKSYVTGPDKILPGFNVSYDGYTGGFGAKGSWTDDDFFYNFFLHAESKTFKFAEDKVTVNAGIYAALSNDTSATAVGAPYKDNTVLGGAVKAHYGLAADKKAGTSESTVVANIAADFQYNKKDEAFKFEIAADAKYNIKEDASENVKLEVYAAPGKTIGAAPYTGDNKDAFCLAAKLTYSGHKFQFNEKMDLTVSGSVDGRDLLVEDREVTVEAKEILNLKLDEKNSLKFTFTEAYAILKAKTLGITARVDYTAEKFTAWAEVDPSFQFADSNKDALTKLAFQAGIKTTKIVDKAELGLTYTKADFVKVSEKIKNIGLISAYAKIAFSGESGK